MRMVKNWHRLPRQMVDASFLETLKVRLDRQLVDQQPVQVDVPAHCRGDGLNDL